MCIYKLTLAYCGEKTQNKLTVVPFWDSYLKKESSTTRQTHVILILNYNSNLYGKCYCVKFVSRWLIQQNRNKTELMATHTAVRILEWNLKPKELCHEIYRILTAGTATKLSAWNVAVAPNDNIRKISVRKTICDLEFSEHLLLNFLPASPRIFEQLKNGIIAHF